ncbi:LLM class flavin-dependent oxidoreductase [Pseudonocardia sp. HH130630-07]|uniref:LLM class flavin-dependent oxidoreductase n=1 Tax=Pseudonocardia sp. HH130630-07 TaxID=1690815 RepID=UPI00202A4409|nr:LLM class flavin-dependent oxidoreductase [Pseudonocardia sp. HH130630-07]
MPGSGTPGRTTPRSATGRFVDRTKLHHVGFTGETFSVTGPSITPRPPQGHPLTVLRGDDPDALPVAARFADVVRVAADSVAAAAESRERVRAAVAAAGRDPERVAVLLDVETLLGTGAGERLRVLDTLVPAGTASGPATLRHVGDAGELAELLRDAAEEGAADGFVLAPLVLPSGVEEIVDDLLPALGDVWVRAPYDRTLRGRFGLTRPENRYAAG